MPILIKEVGKIKVS